MKKTTTIVLALVLALSMFASFAFVVNPGQGGVIQAKANPLAITGFFATSNDAILGGARLYAPLANNTDAAYAKNEVIRFAITMDVLNDMVPANGINTALYAQVNPLTVTSSTVDFAVSNMAGQQALHVPFDGLVNAITSKVADASTAYGGLFTPAAPGSPAKFVLNIKADNTLAKKPSESILAPGLGGDVTLYTPDVATVAKASYAFIFTGITKGEITEKGLAKLVTASTAGTTFVDDEVVSIVKNGRTYLIEKVKTADVKHPEITDLTGSTYYDLAKIGYRVYLVTAETLNDYTAVPVAQLDSESITWKVAYAASGLVGEVEGLGYSLGLEKIDLAAQTIVKATMAAPTVVVASEQARVFRTVLSDGTVRYILGDAVGGDGVGDTAFDATEMARLNTMMADFGFSTADNYTYKLEDKYFTTAGADTDVLTATYNNGTVTPVEPEEEGDVDEGTGEEELPEEGDIDEDLDEDGDITDEEEEVPAETGDFSASIAIALAAAAIVAAAALTVVMKKARD